MKQVARVSIIMFLLFTLSSCASINKDTKSKVILSDESKVWSFETESLKICQGEGGKSYIDVWIQVDNKKAGGVAVRDVMLWRIDEENSRYKISDSFSYDKEGKLQEQ